MATRTDNSRMTDLPPLEPCSLANSILESELSTAAIQETLTHVQIIRTDEGYFLMVRLIWSGEKEWYVTTRRDRSQPKLFKEIKRLIDHLQKQYPTKFARLVFDGELPPQDKDEAKRARESADIEN